MSAKEDKSPRCKLSVPSNANSENQEYVSKSQILPKGGKKKCFQSQIFSIHLWTHLFQNRAYSFNNGPTVKQERSQNLVFKT